MIILGQVSLVCPSPVFKMQYTTDCQANKDTVEYTGLLSFQTGTGQLVKLRTCQSQQAGKSCRVWRNNLKQLRLGLWVLGSAQVRPSN